MSNNIKVSPTPVQRNVLDVATELTLLYFKNKPPSVATNDAISETFIKLHAVASICNGINEKYFVDFLPEPLKSIASRIYKG